MSSCKYEKKMTPTRVKSKERGDVDLNRLVKHGAARIVPPSPTYADLTEIPASRGEAAAKLNDLLKDQDPSLVKPILRMPPAQAMQTISKIRPQASKRDDKTTRKEQGPSTTPPNPGTEPAK